MFIRRAKLRRMLAEDAVTLGPLVKAAIEADVAKDLPERWIEGSKVLVGVRMGLYEDTESRLRAIDFLVEEGKLDEALEMATRFAMRDPLTYDSRVVDLDKRQGFRQ